jgi:hypothetical protein
MRHTDRRGSSARVGVRGVILVTIALFGMMLAPTLASALEEVTTTKAALAPVNTAAPTLTGAPALGQTLTCSTGTWANNPTSFSYGWLRSGVPIAGQTGSTYVVQAADEGHTISCQVTAGNGGGSYTITGLATGSYKIDFFPEEGVNELSQYYNGKSTEAEATPVAVTAPTTTAGVNAELHGGGQISGRVTAAATHAPLQNVDACAYNTITKTYNCAFTNSNGEYTIVGMASGSYTVEFSSFFEAVAYLTQYYNGKSSIGEAQTIGVTVGTTVAGVNAELQSSNQGGQITGTVTKVSGGATIEGIQVCAFDQSEVTFFDSCAVTNSKGEYTLSGLPEGSFEVSFSGENCQSDPCTMQNYIYQYYNGVASYKEATPVIVLAHNTTPGIDAKMVGGGQVEGRVTSAAAGEPPLANTEVCAEESDGGSGCGEANANGEYKIEGLSTGPSYTVHFYSFSGNYLEGTVEHVSVTAGATTPGVDAKLLVGGQLGGRVTGASTHAAIEKVEVCAEASGETYGRCAITNSNGEYTISSLISDSYKVSFYPEGETNYLPQAVSGISVTAGSTTPGVDAELQTGGQITGTVADASTHAGIANVEVCAETAGGGKCTVTETGAASASAASNALMIPAGNFTLVKGPVFDAKKGLLDFFFNFPTAGKLEWGLFFNNADVGFADSLGLSIDAGEGALAEAARKSSKKKSSKCKSGYTKHGRKCVRTLVPFGSGSQGVPAGTVEVKVHVGSKAIKALKAGRTLHVSGKFTFQSALGGPAVSKTVSTVVRMPKKSAKKHGKGKSKGH